MMSMKQIRAGVLLLCGLGLYSTCATPTALPSARPVSPPPVVPVATPSTAPVKPVAQYWAGRTDLIRSPAPPLASELALPHVERWKLDNGLEVVVVPRSTLPIVSFSMAIKAGGYDEQRDQNQGIADFTAAMLRKGTRRRTADAISRTIDFVGGALDANAGNEHSNLNCSVLAKDSSLCLDLMSDVLLNPTFPEAELPEVRDQLLAALAARADDPHQLTSEQLDKLIFGDAHPDGWILQPAHVRAISRAKIDAFWKSFYRPNNAILAVAGDVDVAKIRAAVTKAFSRWKAGPVPPRPNFQIPEARPTRVLLIDKPDLSQSTLAFGHRGLRHADPDWYAATLVNYVLGGSDFSSRLMIEVRSKRGLTYGIGSSFGASLYEGAFRVSAAPRNEAVGEALSVSVAELRKMRESGPTSAELAKAKGYYAGSTPLALESAAGLSGSLVAAALHGLGVDYVKRLAVDLSAVTDAAATTAARRWLRPDDLSVVIMGRADVVRPQLDKAHVPYDTIDYRTLLDGATPRD